MQTKSYSEYMRSPQWKRKRYQVLTYWGHKCGMCYKPGKLQVHHRTYERLGCELITDLIPLCEECHAIFHDGTRAGMEPIQATLARIVEQVEG